MLETACEHLESAPIESWHIRHMKIDQPCRPAGEEPMAGLVTDNLLKSSLKPMPLRDGGLGKEWEAAYMVMVGKIKELVRPALGEAVDAVVTVKRKDHHPGPLGEG